MRNRMRKQKSHARSPKLLELLPRLDVVLANIGSKCTFRKNGREYIIDITFCNPVLLRTWTEDCAIITPTVVMR